MMEAVNARIYGPQLAWVFRTSPRQKHGRECCDTSDLARKTLYPCPKKPPDLVIMF